MLTLGNLRDDEYNTLELQFLVRNSHFHHTRIY